MLLYHLGPLVAEEVTAAELREHAEVIREITEVLYSLMCDYPAHSSSPPCQFHAQNFGFFSCICEIILNCADIAQR